MRDAEILAGLFQRIAETTTSHLRANEALCNRTRVAGWKVNDTNEENWAALSLQIKLGNDQTVDLTLWKNGDPPTVTLWSARTTGEFDYIDHRSFREWIEIAAGLRPDGNICACCGQVNPALFMVPDKVWHRYIPSEYRREIICLGCWRKITQLTDQAAFAANHTERWVFGPPDPNEAEER